MRIILIFSVLMLSFLSCKQTKQKLPNIVLIFTDDQGYADVGAFGAAGFETPNLDQMAVEGTKFTNFYVASSVCSPSRAALLTGCYPKRVGIPHVLFPPGPEWIKDQWRNGLDTSEVTIADMLRTRGYKTACIGKWHLGHLEEFLPVNNGFDYYFGIPYSNDMRPENKSTYPPLPLVENTTTIEELPEDQSMLTTRYTEKAINFIEVNQQEPFFLYLAHSMPHIPLYVSEKFAGKTERGIYGDVIEEIDWSVGQVIAKIEELGLSDNTLIIFTTDNGPWADMGAEGGSAYPLRGSKQTSFEGGMRVPCIMKWKGVIPENKTSDQVLASIDILPTIASMTGAELPQNMIDGVNALDIITGKSDKQSSHEFLYFIPNDELHAVRWQNWKYYFPHNTKEVFRGPDYALLRKDFFVHGPALYNLSDDIEEMVNLVDSFPEIAEKLRIAGEEFALEIEKNKRPTGYVGELE